MAKRRTRGDGSLHLRKDGRWEGRYVVGYDDKGLPMTKNVLAKTKAECAAKLAQLRDTLKEPAPDQPKPGILLTDWLDLWYQGYKKPNLRRLAAVPISSLLWHITPFGRFALSPKGQCCCSNQTVVSKDPSLSG